VESGQAARNEPVRVFKMILTFAFFGSMIAALVLVAFSAWLVSRLAYYAIMAFLAIALILGDLREPTAEPVGLVISSLVFGAFLYFVSVQYLMGRKLTDVTSRDEFKQAMSASNRFSGAIRALYHLPVALLAVGIVMAVVAAVRGN